MLTPICSKSVTSNDDKSQRGTAPIGPIEVRRQMFGGHCVVPAGGDGNRVAVVGDWSGAPGDACCPPKKGARGVYVAIANDFPFFKVGSSTDLVNRLASLRWVMPGGMRALAWWHINEWSRDLLRYEIDLQARLEPWAEQGEWFRADPEALALIESWRRRRPRPVRAPEHLRFKRKLRRRWLVKRFWPERAR